MEYEETLRLLSTIARRVQVCEKQLADLYWDVDQLVQQIMNAEIQKQKDAEKAEKEKKGKAKVEVN